MINLESLKTMTFETENQLQSYCIKLLSQEFPILRGKVFHVKNEQFIEPKEGESTNPKDGAKYTKYMNRCKIIRGQLKALGLLAGVMDILFILNGILYKIELKIGNNTLNESQTELHEIWTNDCPNLCPIVAYNPYIVYMYARWACNNNLKINFTDNFKRFELCG